MAQTNFSEKFAGIAGTQQCKLGGKLGRLQQLWATAHSRFARGDLVDFVRTVSSLWHADSANRPEDLDLVYQLLQASQSSVREGFGRFSRVQKLKVLSAYGALLWRDYQVIAGANEAAAAAFHLLQPVDITELALANARLRQHSPQLWGAIGRGAEQLLQGFGYQSLAKLLYACAMANFDPPNRDGWFEQLWKLGSSWQLEPPPEIHLAAEAFASLVPEKFAKYEPPKIPLSASHERLATTLGSLGLEHQQGRVFGNYRCQFVVRADALGIEGCNRVNIEIAGRERFMMLHHPLRVGGPDALRCRILGNHAVRVVYIPEWHWRRALSRSARERLFWLAVETMPGSAPPSQLM